MNMPLIPDRYTETDAKNHFPIVMQLGILTLILSSVFGVLWLSSGRTDATPTAERYETVPLHTAAVSTTLDQISDIRIRAQAAYVWDVRGERALYKKNESEVLPLASITKLMTALLTYELVPQNDRIGVPLTAILQEGNSGLVAGESLSVEELTEFALISSSNDAAYTLAASVGNLLGDKDATAQFVAGMNIRADELGLGTLEFKNMTGLDVSTTEPGAVGSAKDVSFLMEYIVEQYPEILAPTSQPETRIYNDDGAYHDISNTNVVLDKIPNLIGSKTGYTDLAGGNLTVAFDLGHDRPIIVTVLGSTRDQRFSDVLTLVEAVQASVAKESYE